MSVPNMNDELRRHAYELRYNRAQTQAAALVCSVLREEVAHSIPRDDILAFLGGDLTRWRERRRLWTYTPDVDHDSFDSRMHTCIENCQAKLDPAWRFGGGVARPAPLEIKDLFRLLIGTVDIPLSPETMQFIHTAGFMDEADRALFGRNDMKIKMWRDDNWCDILTEMASAIERTEETQAQLEQICASIEGYTTQKLHEERHALKAAETQQQVEAAVTLAIHREPAKPSEKPSTATTDSLLQELFQLART